MGKPLGNCVLMKVPREVSSALMVYLEEKSTQAGLVGKLLRQEKI
ncbi:hypothetical protein FOPG_18617 [Fusarium oxysporum f. sp. conglutinans race 2 54008]|uniref:Uncharacterized protein n=1 Tax=Fusarium oxysporum f. sp. conglutinans race 2 54008 TaxID=1089457 RepID=X0HVE5_FUSOX|nr:hypothetical protein FOPG_18617 [Fusarium oxysporum f. sp. conglutinans race 2 54008]